MATALGRLSEEDPTFRVRTDEETSQTIISGMGELHLEIIVDRMMREFNVQANVGKPQVAYKETITNVDRGHAPLRQADRRQGHVRRRHASHRAPDGRRRRASSSPARSPAAVFRGSTWPAGGEGDHRSHGERRPGRLPGGGRQGRSRRRAVPRCRLLGDGLQDRRHRMAFKELAQKAKPRLLEPIMDVEVVVPEEYMGDVIGDSDLSPRPHRRNVPALRCARHRRLGAAGGDVRLRHAPALDHAGTRRVLHAVLIATRRCRSRSRKRSWRRSRVRPRASALPVH